MYRFLSSIRHARGGSSAISLFAPKPSLLTSPCASIYSSGLPQNRGHLTSLIMGLQSFETAEHVRGFSSGSSGWRGWNQSGYVNAGPDFMRNRENINSRSENGADTGRNSRPMDFVRGIIEEDGKGVMGGSQFSRYNYEHDADFVHIKMLRNNTFVTVTDSKGNIKLSGSAGCLKEMKAGQKLSRYAAEATAEVVGRRARGLGLKSVVMKVKGFTYFKRKRQAIMSWREGFTDSRGDRNPIVYIEDTTRRPHNGCRLPKKRRI